jgi:serralysin
MTSFVITTAVTTPQTLGLSEIGVIAANGVLAVSSSSTTPAVNINAFAQLIVAGVLSGRGNAVTTSDSAAISVTATGLITAAANAIETVSAEFASTVVNGGSIYGSIAVNASGLSLTVSNTGQMVGDFGAGIVANLTGALTVTNSGTISGKSIAIDRTGAGSDRVINSGIIEGGDAALFLGNGVSRVTNAGVMSGAVFLGGGADSFNGVGGTQDAVNGGLGADTIYGGMFTDRLNGDAGADLIRGNGGDDTLNGGADSDVIYGNLGDDVLVGGTGLDTLRGGMDDDTLTGGTLADTFVFLRNHGTDRITDFQNNVDKLDLRAFDFASVAAVAALASASSFGLRIDVPGEGVVFVAGLTLAALNATDLLL